MATIVVSSGSGPASSSNQFTRMWDDADAQFRKETGKSLRGKPGGTQAGLVNDFLAKLAPDNTNDSSKRKGKKAMEVVGFVLSFVKTMGGFAASAASMVFGPADMCFNAFSFLIDIPKKIAKVYDDLIKLFSEMSTILLEFQVLEKITVSKVQIDQELVTVSHQILITFVNICTKYIKFGSKSKTHFITTALKSVFLDDDCGVLDELQNFQRLARHHSSMIGTVSFKHILDIEEAIKDYDGTLQEFKESQQQIQDGQQQIKEGQKHIQDGVQILVADSNDRKSEILIQKALKTIEEKLHRKSSEANAYLDDLTQIQERLIDGVCGWVDDTEQYQKWIERSSKRYLLCIAGEAKSGKTFLLAEIARRLKLQNIGDTAPDSAPPILYYAFPKRDEKGSSDDKEDTAIVLALKCLALQYAQQHLKYAGDLKLSLSKLGTLEKKDISKLFTTLGICESLKSPSDRLYILLSGLDHLTTEQATELLSLFTERRDKVKQMPRILITGSAHKLDQLSSSSSLRIDIADHNEAGIRQYVDNEMSRIENLQGDHPSILRLREALLKRLTAETERSFTAIRQKLVRVGIAIDDIKTEAEVLATLDDVANTQSEELVKEQLEKLERDLTQTDVEDLNRMLPRLVYGFGTPQVGELEALLQLHRGERPVLSLEKRLKSKFSTIITLRASDVQLREEVKDYLIQRSDHLKEPTDTGSMISLQLNVDRAEKTLVKRFLWDLTKAIDFDNPTFIGTGSEFRRSRIGVDESEAHFVMIENGLQVLGDNPDDSTSDFGRYSLNFLPDHLIGFFGSKPQPDRKRTVCRKLINFFSEPDILEGNWTSLQPWHCQWIDPDWPTTKTIEGLFIDALPLLEPTERRWIVKNVQRLGCRGAFWQPITLMIAKKWLREREWDPANCFKWINNFIELQLTKMTSCSTTEEGAATNSNDDDSPSDIQRDKLSTHDKIMRAAKWVSDELGIATPDATYYERLASNFLVEDQHDTAIQYLETARQLPGSVWRIRQKLASAYSISARPHDARTQLEAAIEDFHASSDAAQGKELVRLLADLARVERNLGESRGEAALLHFKQITEMDPSSSENLREYFELLGEREDIEGARHVLCDKVKDDSVVVDYDLSELPRHRFEILFGWDETSSRTIKFMTAIMAVDEVTRTITAIVQSMIDDTKPGNRFISFTKMRVLFNIGRVCGNVESQDVRNAGLRYLEECLRLCHKLSIEDTEDYVGWLTHDYSKRAIQQLSLWRSVAILATYPGHSESSPEWDDFESTIISRNRYDDGWVKDQIYRTSATYLCRHYVLDKNLDMARKLMLPDAREALIILQDDDPDNDADGFWILGEAFKLTGDDVNALAAFSLIAPTDLDTNTAADMTINGVMDNAEAAKQGIDPTTVESKEDESSTQRPGNLNHSCNGDCASDFNYADDIWACKHCPDVQLCTTCYDRLKKDEQKFQWWGCHPEHEFLHIPPWSDDVYREVGKDNVRIEGEPDENGRIIGGRVVTVKEWLEIVKQIWSLS